MRVKAKMTSINFCYIEWTYDTSIPWMERGGGLVHAVYHTGARRMQKNGYSTVIIVSLAPAMKPISS